MTLALLAEDRSPADYDVARVVLTDRARRGAVAVRSRPGVARRAEPGPSGPLILEARSASGSIVCQVWGPATTSAAEAERALFAARRWAGLDDRPDALWELVADQPVVRGLLERLGAMRLSALPRVAEAFGRAVLSQLVQGVEANTSIAQVSACAGTPATGGLWAWPGAEALAAVPAWTLRRCGVSLRGSRALHEGALADGKLTKAVGSWDLLDRRLRAIPGVGVWTSSETRLALGDPDAVSVGDYHLPSLVGMALAGEPTDDAGMLDLLAPFSGQRGRVVRLCEAAAYRGLARTLPRRAPRAAMSAHRYW